MKNEKHAGGRPRKLSIDEKINLLNLFSAHYGSAAALAALNGHGRFTSLARFAVDMGYTTIHGYDFANDKEFRVKFEKFLDVERLRVERRIVIPEFPFEGLDTTRLLSSSPSDMEKQLAEHKQYCESLYSYAAQVREERDHLSAMVKAKESELVKLRSDISTHAEEIHVLQKKLGEKATLESELRRQMAEQSKLLSKDTRDRALAAAKETQEQISGQMLLGTPPVDSTVSDSSAKSKMANIIKILDYNPSSAKRNKS